MKNEYIWPLLLLAGTLNTCPLAAQETLRGEVKLIGSATEHGQSVTMNELTPNGQHTGAYEAYMKAKPGDHVCFTRQQRYPLAGTGKHGTQREEGRKALRQQQRTGGKGAV